MNIICIVGPTGVGKTKMSIELAKRYNGEVVNADSTQVFKKLDIATAKVTDIEKDGIPHHLFDIKNIDEDYTVFDYQTDARKVIDDIKKRGKTPIVVGGTGLYIKALFYDYRFENEQEIKETYDDIETSKLYEMLINVDSETCIHPNNRKRIIRALNYYKTNNKPMSEKEKTNKMLYNVDFIGLTTDRTNLYERINKRVDSMLADGLLDEARKIYDTNIRNKAVMTPIGYKELFEYFDGLISLEEALELIRKRSRHYAKRQYTWFNNQMNVKWFNVDYSNFNNTIEDVINYLDGEKC